MPTEIDIRQLQRMIDEGAQLVEVLPREEYEEEHLPGAICIPLRKIDDEAPEKLDRTKAVVVYCWDSA